LGYGGRTSILLTLLLSFGSTLWPDEQSGQEHTQVALALALSLLALMKARRAAFEVRRSPRAGESRAGPAEALLGPGRAWFRSRLMGRRAAWLLVAGLAAGFGLMTRYDFAVQILVLCCFL